MKQIKELLKKFAKTFFINLCLLYIMVIIGGAFIVFGSCPTIIVEPLSLKEKLDFFSLFTSILKGSLILSTIVTIFMLLLEQLASAFKSALEHMVKRYNKGGNK